jgi:hypothetical protein
VAWSLADATQVWLTDHDRTMMFVELGCGEHHLAIERILSAVMSNGMTLPETTLESLTRWLDGYANGLEESGLRTMVTAARSHRFEPVPLRIERA